MATRSDAAAAAATPRAGVTAEVVLASPPGGALTGTWRFGQAEGPFARYERSVTVDGAGRATQALDIDLGLPGIGWALGPPLRRHLGRVGPEPAFPWWLPPARMPRRAAVVLLGACALQVLVGYLGDLLAYTMTYAGSEFRIGSAGQGVALGIGQAAAVVSLAALAVADRRGRHAVLLVALLAGSGLTALGAGAPSLWALTASQVAAGGAAGAAAVLVGIRVVEEVPAGARAWSLGVSVMCVGLGSGLAVAAIPLAGTGPGGWRWLYGLGALVAPAAVLVWRRIPPPPPTSGATLPPRRPGVAAPEWSPGSRRALGLLAAGALLLAVFAGPAGSLQAQYLRHERHLSPLSISLLLQVTGTIGGVGTLVGGRLADTRGRRPVAALGLVALVATTVAVYSSHGAGLWVLESAMSAVSYGIGPALGVYGAELFPARLRGRAGGAITVAGAAGGLVGLAVAGVVSGHTGRVAPALAALAAGPLVVAALVWRAYPETAGVALSDLHPGDDR